MGEGISNNTNLVESTQLVQGYTLGLDKISMGLVSKSFLNGCIMFSCMPQSCFLGELYTRCRDMCV